MSQNSYKHEEIKFIDPTFSEIELNSPSFDSACREVLKRDQNTSVPEGFFSLPPGKSDNCVQSRPYIFEPANLSQLAVYT